MLIIRIMGGLGNQLFQYALARSIIQEGKKVCLDIRRPYRNYPEESEYKDRSCKLHEFHITVKAIDIRKIKGWHFLRNETIIDKFIVYLSSKGKWPNQFIREGEFFGKVNKEYFELEGNRYLWGTFQREEYFKNIRSILLNELQLKKEIKISTEMQKLLKSRNVVSIHIRRGDYVIHAKTYGLCNIRYYLNAIAYICEKVFNPVFFFFSDDLEWVKDNIEKPNCEVYYVNDNKVLEDYEELILMSRCKHNIIANSSFSWWGAWLNQNSEKIVIAPKVWIRDTPSYNIVPREWIRM